MASILVLGHSYLHKASASGSIERAFCEHLQVKGVDVTVICSDHNDMSDEGLKCTIIQSRDYQFLRFFIAILKRVIAPDFAFLPDYTRLSWCPSAFKDACQIIESHKIDYILSIGIPHSTHLIAYKLKQLYGISWLAQFYDPWAGNPYRTYRFNYFKNIDINYEFLVAQNADILIHDSIAVARDWKNRYGNEIAKKIINLPFVIDKRQLPAQSKHRKDGNLLIISHIGNFYPTRTSEVFIRAVSYLIECHPNYRNYLRVNYIGSVTDGEKNLISELGLSNIFQLKGTLSADECIKYYQRSDLFLSIDRADGDSYFFPSKILKYFYFQKPILGITPKGSVLDYELTKSGNYSFSHYEIKEMALLLNNAIEDYDSVIKTVDLDYWKNFQVDNVVQKFISILPK